MISPLYFVLNPQQKQSEEKKILFATWKLVVFYIRLFLENFKQ